MMKGTEYKTKEAVLKRAQEAVGKTIGDIDHTGRIKVGKGAIGTVLEESWFGYTPNSESEPDFPEAKVELKATPYKKTKNGISAKERLVCNIINYMTEYRKTFYTSDFWHKCETMLIMSYEYKQDIPKADFTIDKAILFSFPEEDLVIIEQDWGKIIQKIKEGKAHLITEGDTLYLAACTKGASSASVREQPFSPIKAKQRAYSLKSSYMTHILRKYVFGDSEDEHIIKDWHELIDKGLEGWIEDKVSPYIGKTQKELKEIFSITTSPKNLNEVILAKMLGISGKIAYTDEFKNASIVPKTIRIQRNGHIKESMSFPTFKFTEIIKETWDDSELRDYLEPTKFLFVIFRETLQGDFRFERIMFWNIPQDALEEVHKVWEKTVAIIKQGVRLWKVNGKTHNNLPKASENRVAHVRPHGRNAKDTYPLPDGREMTKQCFWLNNTYIESVIGCTKASDILYMHSEQPYSYMVAEDTPRYGKKKDDENETS